MTIAFEHAGRGLRVPLSRRQFEEMTAALLERTRFTVSSLLREAGLTWGEITRLLVVGGSTRMPMVAEMLERESGKTVDRCLAADEAVAHGAAIYAGLLRSTADHPQHDAKIVNVNSHSLGVLGVEQQTGRPRNRVVIPQNTPLPATCSARFRTHAHDQRSVVVHVVEGGDASGNNCTPIGKCVLRELPPGLPAATPVEVTFSYASNGRLSVEASVPHIEKHTRIDIVRQSGLSDTKIDEWGRRLRRGMRPLDLGSGTGGAPW